MTSEASVSNVRAAIIGVVSLALAYALFTLLPLKNPWNLMLFLGGDKSFDEAWRYLQFNSVYLPVLFLLVLVCLRRRPQVMQSPLWALAYGALAGYLAGLVAYPFMSLFLPGGVARLLNSLSLEHAWQGFLVIPLGMLSWLFGMIVWLNAYLIDMLIRRRKYGSGGAS